MKKSLENRYPNSAELFRFCKEALNVKHTSEMKVIDQHVGAILGYDPADCSHWKKGKKNIKSLTTISTIAKHLEIDTGYVADLVKGKSKLEETLQDFKGYGPYAVSAKFQDELKREFFRHPQRYQLEEENTSFEQYVAIDRRVCLALAERILGESEVLTCPVLLPELSNALSPKITIVARAESVPGSSKAEVPFGETPQIPHEWVENSDTNLVPDQAGGFANSLVSTKLNQDVYEISYRGGDMLPHLRTLIAREIGKVFFAPSPDAFFEESELLLAKANLFAGFLLIPGTLLQRALRQLSPNKDTVEQLCEVFWVGRTMMNARIKDFVRNGN